MTGNSQRRGATRKPGSKKGPTGGTGGKGRQALEGRGPTPKAEERPYHVAAKRKLANEKLAATFPFGQETGERGRLNGGWGEVRKRDGTVIKQ